MGEEKGPKNILFKLFVWKHNITKNIKKWLHVKISVIEEYYKISQSDWDLVRHTLP